MVAIVINGVSLEDTPSGFGSQFKSGCGGEVGIAGATKHVQILI
jgi:hypothetical protein